ncbi:ABC transporter permease [Methylomarinum sp. Ch1-1]|uniref:ABC transporter permease n=1 Tax=Methylomarinum roseum TaxID=3067653 RepID=A0AAU7NY18_9GAMM|nr:ABC transporter permease [Methylomarinum sp. Ch1-1]MDP4522012.1 ABC transporter permease [Methylomarinum sp. Ch1-1]
MLGVAFRLAFRELRRNLLRSMLTMLGIIIGVAAVIVLVTLGRGATQQVTERIASLGSNLLMITVGKRMGPGQRSTAPAFKLADAEALAREVSNLAAVAPQATASSTAIYANENWGTTVTGGTVDYFPVTNRQIAGGRIFTASEARSGAAVCIIGDTVRRQLFGAQNPLGMHIRLQKLSCEIIGLLQAKGQSSMGRDQDDIVIVPLRTFQRRIAGNNDVSLIQVSARDGVSTEEVEQDLRRVLRDRRHLSSDEEDDFNVMDMKEIANMLSGTTQTLTGLLGAVAAVSLLVGGIGIMNIMLVSVTERTREIGIRLAIGALEKEILLQFLVEAVVLSSTGGLIGIVLALVTSSILATVLQVPWVLDLPVIVEAFVFSAGVGVIFGYVPARKAARMDPIEALRHE